MERLRTVALPSLLQCPLCRGGLAEEEETFDCPECGTGYHPLCVQDLGGCATLGCSLKGVSLGRDCDVGPSTRTDPCIVEGCERDLEVDTDQPGLCANHSPSGMLTIALPFLLVSAGLVWALVEHAHFPSWQGTPLGDIVLAAFLPMVALATGLLGLCGVVGSVWLSLLRRRHRSVDGAKGGRGSL